jgi:hypothetical protein
MRIRLADINSFPSLRFSLLDELYVHPKETFPQRKKIDYPSVPTYSYQPSQTTVPNHRRLHSYTSERESPALEEIHTMRQKANPLSTSILLKKITLPTLPVPRCTPALLVFRRTVCATRSRGCIHASASALTT